MSKAYKKDGKFYLEPDPVITARTNSKADRAKIKKKLTDEELRDVIDRILTRLDALDARLTDHGTASRQQEKNLLDYN